MENVFSLPEGDWVLVVDDRGLVFVEKFSLKFLLGPFFLTTAHPPLFCRYTYI